MFEHLGTGALVEAIDETHRAESRLAARRFAAIAELLHRRTTEAEREDGDPGYTLITGFQRTASEVAAAMNLSPMAAGITVSAADTLANRLPKVAELLATGDTNWRTVQLVISRTELVNDSRINAALDTKLADRISRWQCWSRRRIINAVDAAVRTLDPDAVRERVRTEDNRHVDVSALPDGKAKVDAIIGAEAAVAFDARLTQLARAVCARATRELSPTAAPTPCRRWPRAEH